MTQLYTSIADVKLAMANGEPSVFVPITGEWRRRLDPNYLMGQGALIEDEVKGLKCPFRGCDKWCQSLGNHTHESHDTSADELKEALGLPRSMAMLSTLARERRSQAQQAIVDRGRSGIYQSIRVRKRAHESKEERKKYRPRTKGLSVAARNWRMTCRAQLQKKLLTVATEHWAVELTQQNAIELLGHATFKKIIRTFGSWNRAKLDAKLGVNHRFAFRLSLTEAVEALAKFRQRHHRWPSSREAQTGNYAPVIPSYNPILRVTGKRTWADALKVVERESRRRHLVAA
jgi:hypothetical protein